MSPTIEKDSAQTDSKADLAATGARLKDVIYTCTECGRVDHRAPISPFYGTDDDSARVAGWRFNPGPREGRVQYCPECTGVDEDYWDRQTLTVAYQAGIDAGSTAWGQM